MVLQRWQNRNPWWKCKDLTWLNPWPWRIKWW
jgi:hypothetical protein